MTHCQPQVVVELEQFRCHIFNICWPVYRWDSNSITFIQCTQNTHCLDRPFRVLLLFGFVLEWIHFSIVFFTVFYNTRDVEVMEFEWFLVFSSTQMRYTHKFTDTLLLSDDQRGQNACMTIIFIGFILDWHSDRFWSNISFHFWFMWTCIDQ